MTTPDSPLSPTSPPKVSVCVMTYNQRNFIGECLDSILEQKTDFADRGHRRRRRLRRHGTREIVDRYARETPGQDPRHPAFQQRGRHCQLSVRRHQAATGAYVAHMDGDELMMPGKLQAQADFLDRHPTCALVGTDAITFSTAPDGSHLFEGRYQRRTLSRGKRL